MSSIFGDNAAPKPGTGRSLFDRITPRDPVTTTASSTSLFGSTATSAPAANAATGTGLFGAAAQPASTAASGLFGAAAQPTTSASGLFGSTTATTTAGSSLFGGTAQPTASSAGGLFGSLSATSQPAKTGSSLFGGALGANPTTTAPSTSLFGATTATSKPAAATSLFSAPASQPAQPANSLLGASTQPTTGELSAVLPSNPSYFDQLLERGRKRQTEEHLSPSGELPQLELGLADISRKVRNLGQGGPSAGLAKNGDLTKAHYLLSASGVNTSRALRDLDHLYGDIQPLYESELSGMNNVKRDLTRKYKDDFQQMIDSHIKNAHDDFNKMIDEQLHGVDWTAYRQRIYEHFGLKKPQSAENDDNESGAFGRSRKLRSMNGKSFGVSGINKSIIGAPGMSRARQSQFTDVNERLLSTDGWHSAPTDRITRIRQEKYVDRVKDLNVSRINKATFPVLQRFAAVENEQPGDNTAMLLNSYKALGDIVGEGAGNEGSQDLRERQFAKDYLDDGQNAHGSFSIRKRILEGSRQFLERLFFEQLELTVNKNPREANVGGIPTAVAKVKGYVRVRVARRELGPDVEVLQEVAGDYCWAVIFYLLRAGLTQEAVQYVDENANAFRHIDRKFMSYLRQYVKSPERRLPQKEQTDIHNDYSQRTKLAPEDSIDPYRMMCYKIIGRCDLQRRTIDTINSDMMDFLWLQFALAREYNRVDEFAYEAFGLEEIRNTVKDIGERYFGSNSDIPNAPTTYFFMQLLAGSFEKAVTDLFPHNYVAAVHFAIALDYYGLLRVTSSTVSEDLLSYTTRQQPQIAFSAMIGQYTADFRAANPAGAVDYLTLICLNADLPGDIGRAHRDICHQALTELVLETREFAQLLGDIRADGQRIQGTIEVRQNLIHLDSEAEFLRHITLVAARTAEDNGRTTDAALLYHLAEDYDKVVVISNEAVSIALTTELGQQPQKLVPLKPRTGTTGDEIPRELQGSLSLTAVDDPIELARNFRNLYNSREMYSQQIKDINRGCSELLLALADARHAVEAGQWAAAVDYINNTHVLPSEAHGDMALIRHSANNFNNMPTVAARTIGHVMVWTVLACTNHVANLKRADFETQAQQNVVDRCISIAKDVMLFAGLIRYKLPGRIWDMLAQASQELGVY